MLNASTDDPVAYRFERLVKRSRPGDPAAAIAQPAIVWMKP